MNACVDVDRQRRRYLKNGIDIFLQSKKKCVKKTPCGIIDKCKIWWYSICTPIL